MTADVRAEVEAARGSSAMTRYWHYIAFACWAAEHNRKCWCQGRNGTPGRICRGCTRRWLAVEAVAIENDMSVALQYAGRRPMFRRVGAQS